MIREKLTAVQNELKVPKNRYNKFGEFYYRSAEDIEEAIKPLLEKYEMTLSISNDIISAGNRIYVQSTATLADADDSFSVSSFAREPEMKKGMDESQITGAAVSYANKYALGNMFLINDTADADTMDNRNDKAEENRKEEFKAFCHRKKEEGADLAELKKFYEFYTKEKDGKPIIETMNKWDSEARYEKWISNKK